MVLELTEVCGWCCEGTGDGSRKRCKGWGGTVGIISFLAIFGGLFALILLKAKPSSNNMTALSTEITQFPSQAPSGAAALIPSLSPSDEANSFLQLVDEGQTPDSALSPTVGPSYQSHSFLQNLPSTLAQEHATWWIFSHDTYNITTEEEWQDRFLLAVLYFDTTQLNLWRSCNPAFVDDSAQDDVFCSFDFLVAVDEYVPSPAIRWLSSVHHCDWVGVSCNKNKEVETLSLFGLDIQGSIPAEVGLITNLDFLDMSFNALTGSLPTTLSGLRHIELQSNLLTGSIPDAFFHQNPLLEALILPDNALTGTVNEFIGDLLGLGGVWLYYNQFTGTLPESLYNLPLLTTLQLRGNKLNGTLSTELGDLRRLQTLSLAENELSSTLPTELGRLGHLSVLSLDGNARISGSIPHELFNLTRMERLRLSGMNLTGTLPSLIGNLDRLQVFSIYDNALTGSVAPFLAPYLTLVELQGNGFDGVVDVCENSASLFAIADCLTQVACKCCDVCCNDEFCCDSNTGECY